MPVSHHAMALTFFLTSLVAAPVFAQPPPPGGAPANGPKSGAADVAPSAECKTAPTEAESEAAHGAYLAGKGSFDEADYTTAVTYFKDAYRRDCTKPELLLALARAYELKGDRAEAVNALETYLRRVPGPGSEAVQRRVAALKAQMATAGAPSPSPTAASSGAAATDPASPNDRKRRSHSVYPWIVAGSGVVLAGVGLSLLVIGAGQVSQSKEDATAAGCSGTRCPAGVDTKPFQDKNDSGAAKRTAGIALVSVGAAAIAGGVVWYFVEPSLSRTRKLSAPASPKASWRAQPDVGPGYAGLSLGGAF